MRSPTLISLATLALGALGSIESSQPVNRHYPPVKRADTPVDNSTIPRNFGVVLFPAFDPQDVFGPLEVLQLLSTLYEMNLHVLAETLDPVATGPGVKNPFNSSFWSVVQPSHTFADNPDLDVLIVPGGAGVRSPDINSTLDYITRTYPKVKYLISVCTGSGVLARTGLLDGKRATTNKLSWPEIVPMGPLVKWVNPARWVVDGNIWTSSGSTAGIDLIFSFVKAMYPDGQAHVDLISHATEYEVHDDFCWDPYAATNTLPRQNQPDCGSDSAV